MKFIEVFTTSTCGYCTQLKKHLSERGFAYQEYNLEDTDSLTYFRTISDSMSVPVVSIDGEVVVGFKKEVIDALLDAL